RAAGPGAVLNSVAAPAPAAALPRVAPPAAVAACRELSSSTPATAVVDDMSNHDGYFEKDRLAKGDPSKREFTYLVLGGARFIYASSARLILMK
ncbi:unnamed protein product, partial [Discosporangium mesarthrocarpum]